MLVSEYIKRINDRYKSGLSTEHSYRSDLLILIESLIPGITITNEPKRVACGAPDYIITRRNIPVGYIEAKDLGADLNSKTYKEQFDRYKQSLDNLIITDYLTFQFFVNGSATTLITIGEISGKKIHPIPANFERFIDLIENFCEHSGQTIKSAQKLSKMMAAKAKLLANVIELAVEAKNEAEGVSELQNINILSQYESFKQILIHDITPKAFADIYAQTIAYGMFAARLNDPSLENFTRQEAAELIPKSNPFLRKLFQYIAGYDLDDRIVWIVDALADIFRATNVEEMLKDFGKPTHQTDLFIHFYETFLSEYDPKLRKSRGVWYTPEPVVNFIVRAVDDILKTEFGLSLGLADTSRIKIKVPGQEKKPIEKEVHRVQILDPAAGTGTFLAEVIKQIHNKFEGQQGIWSQYVEDHLIPRLNGFEILMASYAMAHLKLEMLLRTTGYTPQRDQRLKVYLTNSLEEQHPDTGTLFANWLSVEANEANHIKRDTPVMVVIGNPPYSGISTNKGKWITDLIEDYKYVNGVYFGERKHWLQDDYVKFIRLGESLIEKNGVGVLAFINNHSFLDNPTFRGMRWHLLKTFDKIYIIDLHGNSVKMEITPDGLNDENVFDIKVGVSINIFVKTGSRVKNTYAEVKTIDLWGERSWKYSEIQHRSLREEDFSLVKISSPYFFFKNKDETSLKQYNEGFYLGELFQKHSMGVTTARDNFVIDFDKHVLENRVRDFTNRDISTDHFQLKYALSENYQWKLEEQRRLTPPYSSSNIMEICYRPFDNRYIYYQDNLVFRSRKDIMRHLLLDNIAINLVKVGRNSDFHNYLVSDSITDKSITSSLDNSNTFPLYIYSELIDQTAKVLSNRRESNLNSQILSRIATYLHTEFSDISNDTRNTFSSLNVFDYIYATLYSPSYRAKFKELLKIDFPRIPYPHDLHIFWKLVEFGGALRKVHLLQSPLLGKFLTTYPVQGSNMVEKVVWENEKVWVNMDQFFDGVQISMWEFYIGGYQPAQKWLKDRKGRVLSYEEIMHYQKIILALAETDRIMSEIDKIDFLP